MAAKPAMQAVIAPSTLALLHPLDGQGPVIRASGSSPISATSARMASACVGAVRVSIDFAEGRLACKKDPRNPRTGMGMLEEIIETNNRAIDRFTVEERRNIGVRTCPGGGCDSTKSSPTATGEGL